MKNFKKEGKSTTWTADGSYSSGDFAVIGDRACPLMADAENGEQVEALLEGVVTYPMAAVVIAQGKKLYFDAGSDVLTTSSSGNKPAGWADTSQASTDSEVACKLGAW
jgi:predicted RecA/RadA family phage recombinase